MEEIKAIVIENEENVKPVSEIIAKNEDGSFECMEINIQDLSDFQEDITFELTEEEQQLFDEADDKFGDRFEEKSAELRERVLSGLVEINSEERNVLEAVAAPNFMDILKEEFEKNPVDYKDAQNDPSWMF